MSENISDEEKNILPSIKKLLNINGGIICFKIGSINIFDIEKVLKKMNYCEYYDTNAYETKTFTTFSGLKILYLKYNTGSGY
jgi:hypothetical protein